MSRALALSRAGDAVGPARGGADSFLRMNQRAYLRGSPAEALGAVARHLGLPADPTTIARHLEAHDAPTSLLALVRVSPRLGLRARAFQADASGLAGATLPLVVHLGPTAEDEPAFGVVVERRHGSVVLAGRPGLRPVELPLDAFAELWTGVLVTFERVQDGPPVAAVPRFDLAARLRARFAADRPGGPWAAGARWVGAAVLLGLAVIAVLRGARGSAEALARLGVLALHVAAVAACATLLLASRRTGVPGPAPRLSSAVCGRGRLTDCHGVLSSRWARIFGLDLASLGLAMFASSVVLWAIAGVLPAPALAAAEGWLAVAWLVAAPGSLFLVGVQVWPLRRFCPLCMTVHAAVLAAALVGLPALLRGAPGAASWAWGALHLGLFTAALGILVPWLELGLESYALRARTGWVASTPWGALAELAGRPVEAGAVPPAPIELGSDRAQFRIDALVHPFCSGCGPVIEQLDRLAGRHAELLRIGLHLPPRDPGDPTDREMCAGLAAIGQLAGGAQTMHVLREVKARPRVAYDLAAQGGAAALARRYLGPDLPIEEALDPARASVDAADLLSAALSAGTPTVLFHGRRWDASLDDLDLLLAEHPELLADTLGVERPAPRRDRVETA